MSNRFLSRAAVALVVASSAALLGFISIADPSVGTDAMMSLTEEAAPVTLKPITANPIERTTAGVEEEQKEAERERLREEVKQRLIRRAAEHYDIDRELAQLIHDSAVEAGIDPDLAFGLVWVESRFDPNAVSSAGALGIAQVMPATAREVRPDVTQSDLFEPDTNLRIGMKYLRHLLNVYDGDLRLALTAYNRGPGKVSRALENGEEPENGYASMVLENGLAFNEVLDDAGSWRVPMEGD